jgi:hypothetical protein
MDRAQELAALKAKLMAREGRPGLSDNVRALKERIAELEGEA